MDFVGLLNNNPGLLAVIAIAVSIALAVIGWVFFRDENPQKKIVHKSSVKGNGNKTYQAGRDITINSSTKKKKRKSEPKLRLSIENRQANDRAVVLENPHRGFFPNQLFIVVYNNDSSADAEDVEVRLEWPFENIRLIRGVWDKTGNKSCVWENVDREIVYSQKERIYAKSNSIIGRFSVRSFDGIEAKIRYKILAKNTKLVKGEILIKKVEDPQT